jgi:S-adenosylmethionine:tRNA ribosyltransferase-isomerase
MWDVGLWEWGCGLRVVGEIRDSFARRMLLPLTNPTTSQPTTSQPTTHNPTTHNPQPHNPQPTTPQPTQRHASPAQDKIRLPVTPLRRSDFAFDLPSELIAQEPRERGHSRLLVVSPQSDSVEHSSFSTFPSRIRSGDVVVLNDTRVFPARLEAAPVGNMSRSIEILLTREIEPLVWEALAKPSRRLKRGTHLSFGAGFDAEVVERRDDGSVAIRFAGDREAFWAAVEMHGAAPLPPYIRRESAQRSDRSSYQTVFADRPGAVAAPTAGLHFTQQILDAIVERGGEIVRVTLHVGPGTFLPVKADLVTDHRMQSERYEIREDAALRLERALSEKRRIVAVGTTSVRTLESAIGDGGTFRRGWNETSIFITPGFRFRVVDALLTNFHLPESTLIMLVSAFAGVDRIRRAYREAVRERYLFYSYGDAMFIDARVRDALAE